VSLIAGCCVIALSIARCILCVIAEIYTAIRVQI